jgi:hypothetical protein
MDDATVNVMIRHMNESHVREIARLEAENSRLLAKTDEYRRQIRRWMMLAADMLAPPILLEFPDANIEEMGEKDLNGLLAKILHRVNRP